MTNDFKDTPWGIVYYLYDPKRDLIKIGTTKNLKERMSSHKRFYGRLHVLGMEPGSYSLEREIHKRWEKYRKKVRQGAPSEWFHCNDELLQYIQQNTMRYDTYNLVLGMAHGAKMNLWDTMTAIVKQAMAKFDNDIDAMRADFQAWRDKERTQ